MFQGGSTIEKPNTSHRLTQEDRSAHCTQRHEYWYDTDCVNKCITFLYFPVTLLIGYCDDNLAGRLTNNQGAEDPA